MDDAALKNFLAPVSVLPAEHSLAQGKAPAKVQDAFAGWSSVFDNTEPILIGWFPQGVPSMLELKSSGNSGVADIRFKGVKSAPEAVYWMNVIVDAGIGCGVVVFQKKVKCHKARCVPNAAFGRCIHYIATRNFSEADAERGTLMLREKLEKEGYKPPNERWAFEGDRAKSLGSEYDPRDPGRPS